MQSPIEVQVTNQQNNYTEQDDSSQSNSSNAMVLDTSSGVISNYSPQPTMLLADLNKILESNDQNKGQRLIFKRNFKNVAENLILASFENMMQSKPIWTACIRESRSLGFISITVKTDSVVENERFAFINGQWQCISGQQLQDHNTNLVKLENIAISRDDIADGCQSLLNCIFATYPQLTLERFIVPAPEQQSVEEKYSGYAFQYTPVKVQEIKIHNNPVDALVDIAGLLDTILANFEVEIKKEDIDLLKKCFSTMQYSAFEEKDAALKECFYNWLESKNLQHDVTSAVSLSLLDKPRLLDSGHVFSKEDLIHGEHPIERCPLTREIISTTPSRVPLWGSNLQLCLDKFTQLLNRFDEKAILSESDPIETNASSLLGVVGFFEASNESAQTSSPNNTSETFSL